MQRYQRLPCTQTSSASRRKCSPHARTHRLEDDMDRWRKPDALVRRADVVNLGGLSNPGVAACGGGGLTGTYSCG